MNRFFIGIELVNWGKLVQRDGRFFTWPTDYTNPYDRAEPVFLEGDWWEPYPEEQLAVLHLLLDDIRARHPIEAIVGYLDVSPGRKLDPGPALNLAV
ncbi:N-acetylmuramoyl-L-alanine amidase [bacterium]|nr:N-acetylmuramoyl-L-alanine amidase [bacterium]